MSALPAGAAFPVRAPKKLIEVALPLDAINKAAAREKSIRHGHPSTLHLWWARRPLAAARAVIFAQLVNDPSWRWELDHPGEAPPGTMKGGWANARRHLFKLIEDLVQWENTTNEQVLERARAEIKKSWRETCEVNAQHSDAATLFNPDKLPGLHDPFAGGGTIPLEAQRLGLEAHASDLNPVAVLINKAMIEIPPKFAGRPPVGPRPATKKGKPKGSDALADWSGAKGLAEDVRRYGAWMRDEAQKRIGHLYPPVEVTADMAADRPDLLPYVGRKLTVIAWLWARTVHSPNPAFRHVAVPLASTFVLSSKPGKQSYVHPVINADGYRFTVRTGTPPAEAKAGTGAGKRAAFRCVMSGVAVDYPYIREEGKAGRMGQKLMAIVCEGDRGRVYLEPTADVEAVAASAEPTWKPDLKLPDNTRDFKTPNYGLMTFGDLFTPRQLVALTTFSDLVSEARQRVRVDSLAAGMADDGRGLDIHGMGATAYGEAVSVYLAFAVDRSADFWCNLCTWANQPSNELVAHLFGRQAIPMAWDFAEAGPFSDSGGNFTKNLDFIYKVIGFSLGTTAGSHAKQIEAQKLARAHSRIISTDPPYYDNVGYADLSDFFYVWMRRSLRSVFPDLLATISVPKCQELVASPYRHGGKEQADRFFLNGMKQSMQGLAEQSNPSVPLTIYYAFKQAETQSDEGTSSSGWETFLEAIMESGLTLGGTWPMRTERPTGVKTGMNALASSIILVCRPRAADAETIGRARFVRELKAAMGPALDLMIKGDGSDRSPVAPVDLSQAIIGPGMAVFSRYAAVLEADGTPMTVRTALQLINRHVADDDFDADTRFCLDWFESHGWENGPFGTADVLARAKGTAVSGVQHAGVIASGGGQVRLLRAKEYPADWDAATDDRLPVWELLHHLVRLHQSEGDAGAGRVLAAVPGKTDSALKLAYRLYTLCERKKWADDARGYNELVAGWGGIEQAATTAHTPAPATTGSLFDGVG